MGITGDFGKLASWGSKLGGLPGIVDASAETVAPLFTADVQAAIDAQAAPDGAPFATDVPATYRRGTSAILRRSGAMYAAVTARAQAAALSVSVGVAYIRFQVSRGRSPLPQALPSAWGEQLRTAAKQAFREALK